MKFQSIESNGKKVQIQFGKRMSLTKNSLEYKRLPRNNLGVYTKCLLTLKLKKKVSFEEILELSIEILIAPSTVSAAMLSNVDL